MLSTPEPGLALLGAGKRDVPLDAGLPVVLAVRGADGSGATVGAGPGGRASTTSTRTCAALRRGPG